MIQMETAIRTQLGFQNVHILRSSSLDSDHGKCFLKYGDEDLVRGEFESLKAIESTNTIACPKPMGIVERNGSWALISGFIHFQHGKDWAQLGNLLARMHKKNSELIEKTERNGGFVGDDHDAEEFCTKSFGFHVPTCCGRLAQDNTWTDSWTDFFIHHRLQPQINRLIEHGERSLHDVSDLLYLKTDKLLENRKQILPSLVHGDLWGGNWSMMKKEDSDDEDGLVPVIFDPSASSSDPEFEFGIMSMFGGWTREFEREYDKVMGSATPGKDARIELYELYHNLNHWNHFGGSYRNSSLSLIRSILSH